jgi:hypothetical protein
MDMALLSSAAWMRRKLGDSLFRRGWRLLPNGMIPFSNPQVRQGPPATDVRNPRDEEPWS